MYIVRRAHTRIDQATLKGSMGERMRAVGNPPGPPRWPVSLVPHVSHVSRQRNYARTEGQSGEGVKCKVKQ